MNYKRLLRKISKTRKKYYNVVICYISFIQYCEERDLGDLLEEFEYESISSVERIIRFMNEFLEDMEIPARIIFRKGKYRAYYLGDNTKREKWKR